MRTILNVLERMFFEGEITTYIRSRFYHKYIFTLYLQRSSHSSHKKKDSLSNFIYFIIKTFLVNWYLIQIFSLHFSVLKNYVNDMINKKFLKRSSSFFFIFWKFIVLFFFSFFFDISFVKIFNKNQYWFMFMFTFFFFCCWLFSTTLVLMVKNGWPWKEIYKKSGESGLASF